MARDKGIPTMLRAYAEDYAGWAEDTAKAMEDGRFEEIDRRALADEVRDLARARGENCAVRCRSCSGTC